jgi:prepilin-type N-terminal cleavage/methylation domain-containing protein
MSNIKKTGFKNNKKRAFTLVELSIVLIIIGLLIVAITSGASLVRNAKLRSITNEAKQYQVAVMSFYSKFDEYPGDFNQSLGTLSAAGDNDDIIEWVTENDTTAEMIYFSEGTNAWHQLEDENILPDDTVGATASIPPVAALPSLVLDTDYPSSAENGTGWLFGSQKDAADSGPYHNYIYLTGVLTTPYDGIANNSGLNEPAGMSGAITAGDAYSIDNKNDNGDSATGNIRGEVSTCTTYDLTLKEAVCGLAFKVSIN